VVAYDIGNAVPLWEYHGNEPFESGAGAGSTLLEGNELLLALQGEIRKLDRQGKVVHSFAVDEADLRGGFIQDQTLLCGAWDQGLALCAFDTASGKKRWSHALGAYNALFTLESGTVSFRQTDDLIVGLDASNGDERFRFPLNRLHGAAAVPPSTALRSRGRLVGWMGSVLAAVQPNLLVSIDVRSGALQWVQKLQTENPFGFAVYQDKAFVLGYQTLELLDAASGALSSVDVEDELNRVRAFAAFSQLAPTEDHLYCTDAHGLLLALNHKKGTVDWTTKLPSPMRAGDIAVAVDGKLWVVDGGEHLNVLAATAGT